MQKQPFPYFVEWATMFAIILIVYVLGDIWYTGLATFLTISLWFVSGENGFYHGYTHHKK